MNTLLNRDNAEEVLSVERFIEQLAVLMPIYREGGGDMTRVILQDGQEWDDPRPLYAVLKGIARHFAVDLVAVRERYGAILGKRLYVPLPLSPHLTLVPLKMRLPRVYKDGTTGYVVSGAVDKILMGSSTTCCQVEVRGAGFIDCLQSRDFAVKQMLHADIVQMYYRQTMNLRVMT
jgi:hypothetical protein